MPLERGPEAPEQGARGRGEPRRGRRGLDAMAADGHLCTTDCSQAPQRLENLPRGFKSSMGMRVVRCQRFLVGSPMQMDFDRAFAASEHPTKSAPAVKIWRQDCHEARDVSRHGSFRIVPRRPADWHCRIGMIAKAGLTFEVGGRRALLCDRATKSFWGSGDLQGSFGVYSTPLYTVGSVGGCE